MTSNATSSAEAKALRLKYYFTGKPCVHGHVALRHANGNCVECRKTTNRDAINEQTRKSYTKHAQRRRVEARAYCREARRKDPEKFRARDRARYLANPEKRKATVSRAAKTALERRRVALKLKQQCSCCSNKHFRTFYEWAKMLGDEVDHRVPLALGGRHCVGNLQTLSADEHKTKSAKDAAAFADVRLRTKLFSEWRT